MRNRRLNAVLLLLPTGALLVLALLPMLIFSSRSGPSLARVELAMRAGRVAPAASLLLLFLMALAGAGLLSGARRWWSRAAVVAGLLLGVGAAWLARQNIFERVMRPLRDPPHARPGAVTLDDEDRVLAIGLGGEAMAYPVRQLAYHHVVHDRLGGVPVVVTY